MRTLRRTSRFKKDFKRAKRAGKPLAILEETLRLLQQGKPLPAARRDHALMGNLGDLRECHLAPDWLMVYQPTDDELVLVRLGSHSELFG
ncbi:MAG: type II toxin-antitoxin system YafQ family toxin [Verrucomicrobia subdivision 3 bacterium]|nr:type II toxin-antitoxin system YafQ family toxin [Limisphaerales bacterium]